MKSQIRSFHAVEVHDLQAFQPAPAEPFGFLLQVFIGPEDEPGEEMFTMIVCNAAWMVETTEKYEQITLEHVILMPVFDYQELERMVKVLFTRSGKTWDEIVQKISRYATFMG